MSEVVSLAELADVNPENLGSAVARAFRFRYVDLSSVARGTIKWQSTSVQSFGAAPSRARRVLRTDDVLFGTVRPGLRSHARFAGRDEPCVASTGFAVIRARAGVSDPAFLAHYLLGEDAACQARRMEVGSGYPAINESDVGGFCLPALPLDEQVRIAEILDTSDEAIQATERVIDKLTQARSGMVSNLLEPATDWVQKDLGDVLKDIEGGKSPDVPDRPPGAGEWSVLKVSAIQPWGLLPRETKALIHKRHIRPQHEVHDGDVLVSRANTPALVGLCCYVQSPPPRLLLSDKTLRLVPGHSVLPAFLALMLQSPSARAQLEMQGTGSSGSMKNISQAEIRSLRLSWPSLGAQKRIACTVRSVDSLLRTERSRLMQLRNSRAGLAADLLSGRVRTVAA